MELSNAYLKLNQCNSKRNYLFLALIEYMKIKNFLVPALYWYFFNAHKLKWLFCIEKSLLKVVCKAVLYRNKNQAYIWCGWTPLPLQHKCSLSINLIHQTKSDRENKKTIMISYKNCCFLLHKFFICIQTWNCS